MMREDTYICLVHLDEMECIETRGGDSSWESDIVKGIGYGTGYVAKKIVKALQFLSKSLYEMQSRTMVIYK